MHYCQTCDDSHLMEPVGDTTARCPVCGSEEVAMRRLRGECLVFDMDWLIDPFGGDVTTLDWTMLRDSWLHVAHGVAQNGLPTLVLGSFLPEQVDALPARRWIGAVHFLVLDVADGERARRIDARPAGRTHDVEPQVAFGQWLRANIPDAIDTTTATPDETANAVTAWAREVLGSGDATAAHPPR